MKDDLHPSDLDLSTDVETGTSLSVVVPSPTAPYLFHPQHLTPPLDVKTQVD